MNTEASTAAPTTTEPTVAAPETTSPTTPETAPTEKASLAPASSVAAEEGSILDEGEPKPEGEEQNAADGETKPEGESAGLEITIPEGFVMNDEAMQRFQELAGSAKLDTETAQNLFNLYYEQTRLQQEKNWNDWQATQKAWKEEIKADSEIGGEKLADNMRSISKAIDLLAGENPAMGQEFRQALKFTGAGNNPAIVRLLFRAAERLTEGRIEPAGKPSEGGQSPASKLYPGESRLGNQMNT